MLNAQEGTVSEARTDSHGEFRLTIAPGEYRVLASAPGFARVTKTVFIQDGPATADVQFEKIELQLQSVY